MHLLALSLIPFAAAQLSANSTSLASSVSTSSQSVVSSTHSSSSSSTQTSSSVITSFSSSVTSSVTSLSLTLLPTTTTVVEPTTTTLELALLTTTLLAFPSTVPSQTEGSVTYTTVAAANPAAESGSQVSSTLAVIIIIAGVLMVPIIILYSYRLYSFLKRRSAVKQKLNQDEFKGFISETNRRSLPRTSKFTAAHMAQTDAAPTMVAVLSMQEDDTHPHPFHLKTSTWGRSGAADRFENFSTSSSSTHGISRIDSHMTLHSSSSGTTPADHRHSFLSFHGHVPYYPTFGYGAHHHDYATVRHTIHQVDDHGNPLSYIDNYGTIYSKEEYASFIQHYYSGAPSPSIHSNAELTRPSSSASLALSQETPVIVQVEKKQ
ncbi:hypothetical protein HDU91_005932 [Kappamyces sp. JEL0680]|nr:hypothetical protein HDU91_005932 [Kappamyces sp. JEL0680]